MREDCEEGAWGGAWSRNERSDFGHMREDCEEGRGAGLGVEINGLILLTCERMFGSLFLCSRRKTSSLRHPRNWRLRSVHWATRSLPKSSGAGSGARIYPPSVDPGGPLVSRPPTSTSSRGWH